MRPDTTARYGGLYKSLLLSIAILVPMYLIWGMYLEDNEAIVSLINYGIFGRLGPEQYASDYQTLCLPLLYHISMWCTSVPVYGIWKFGFAVICLTAMLYYLKRYLEINGVQGRLNYAIGVILILILTADSFVNIHCIRQSILLGFISLAINQLSVDAYGRMSKVALAVFVLAVITRMHSAVIILAVFLAYHVLRGVPVWKVIRLHLPMIVIGAAFILVYQIYGIYTTNYGKYIEANYEYATIEKASLYPISDMKSEADSMKYVALQKFFITDSAEFSKAFFDRVVNLNYHEKFRWADLHLSAISAKLLSQSKALSYMPAILLVLALLAVYGSKTKKDLIQPVLFASLAMGAMAMLLIGLVDEIKIRFFSPYIGMTFLLLIMMPFAGFARGAGRVGRSILMVLVAAILVMRVTDLHTISLHAAQREEAMKVASAELQAAFERHPTLIFMGADIPMRSALFYRPAPDLYRNMACFDGGYLIYFSYAKDKFERLFTISPLDYRALIGLFRQQKDLRFYATPDRAALVERYFASIYKTALKTEEQVAEKPQHSNGSMYTVSVRDNYDNQ